MSEQTPASWWALVLSDWRRSNATVTVHLRGGAVLGPGRVMRVGSSSSGESGQLESYNGHQTKWDFDLTEVAAITAEAR